MTASSKNKKSVTSDGVMFLCKENFEEGDPFYFFMEPRMTKSAMIYCHEESWRELEVLILSPELKATYKHIPVIALTNPLFPLSRLPIAFPLNGMARVETRLNDNISAVVENQIHTMR